MHTYIPSSSRPFFHPSISAQNTASRFNVFDAISSNFESLCQMPTAPALPWLSNVIEHAYKGLLPLKNQIEHNPLWHINFSSVAGVRARIVCEYTWYVLSLTSPKLPSHERERKRASEFLQFPRSRDEQSTHVRTHVRRCLKPAHRAHLTRPWNAWLRGEKPIAEG